VAACICSKERNRRAIKMFFASQVEVPVSEGGEGNGYCEIGRRLENWSIAYLEKRLSESGTC